VEGWPAFLNPPNPPTPPQQAFDEHVNVVLGDCEETHTTEEVDSETGETIVKRNVRQLGMLFVRGDIIVHVSPPLRAA
jgi:U6 snRNA-associated Sm-like protein LSm3